MFIKKVNSESERRSLIWKYFWERKRNEIWKFFKENGIVLFLFQIFLFSITGGVLRNYTEGEPAISPELGVILLCIVLIEIIIFILGILFYHITKWLRSNWRLATQDTDKELKKRRRNE